MNIIYVAPFKTQSTLQILNATHKYKYSCTCTLSLGEADLVKENNYQAAPANRLRLATSSGTDYIFSIHPPLSPTPAV